MKQPEMSGNISNKYRSFFCFFIKRHLAEFLGVMGGRKKYALNFIITLG